MKKFFTFIAMVAATVGIASAASYTAADIAGNPSENTELTSVTFGNYTMAFDKGAEKNNPVYNANNKDIRVYAKETVTLTSTGNTFNKVVFNLSAQGLRRATDIAATAGSVTVDVNAKTATWTGDGASTVTFTVGEKAVYGSDGNTKAGQLCFSSLDITEGTGAAEETVTKPTFSVAAGTYFVAQNVAINCGTSGATIYYTLDGTEPTAASTVYSAPINVATSTTIKAIAIKGDKQSEVAEAAYVIGTPTAVANIAAFQAVADAEHVQFTNPVNVLAQNGKNLYVKDATGYAFIYGEPGVKYKNGDVIPAGFTGEKKTYNGQPELSVFNTDGFQAASGNTAIDPEEMTTAGVTAENFGHYVIIKNATISYYYKTMTDAAGTAQIRTGMGGYGSTTDSTKTYDIIAVIGSTKQGDSFIPVALPVKLTEAGSTGGDDPVVTDGITIAEFNALADNAAAKFGRPATVLAQNGSRLFVTDGTGYMLIYGNVGKTYKQGDVIPAGFSGTKTTYDGEPELKGTFAGFEAATSTVTVTPEELTAAATVAHENFGHYVVAKNVTIDATGKKITLENGDVVPYHTSLYSNIPSDGGKYDVYAIIGSYGKTNTIYQLLPTNITVAGGGEVALPEVEDIAALYNMTKGATAKITGDITAIYQNGNNLYVKSGDTYSLVYGKLTNTFENGDVMNNVVASWTEYNGAKQLSPVDSTFVVARKGDAVEPTEIALEEVGTDMVHNYLIIKAATLTPDTVANTYFVADETLSDVKMFNKFKIEMPQTLEGKQFDVTCFVTVYKGAIELYPVAIAGEEEPQGEPCDVNNDGNVDITDVNIVINVMLGKEENAKADINGDGNADITDVNAVINKMLGK